MEENNKIDDLFRSGIEGYRINPSNQSWKNIEKGFFKKKGFFFYRWHIIAAAVLLLISAGGIWYSSLENDYLNGSKNELVVKDGKEENFNETNEKLTDPIIELSTDITNVHDNNKASELKYNDEVFTGNNLSEQVSVNSTILNTETNEPDKVSDQLSDQFVNDNSEGNSKFDGMSLSSSYILGLDALSVGLSINMEADMIDPEKVTGMEEFLEKQRRSHLYTGANFNGGMVYYPSTTDQFTWSAGISFGIAAGNFYVQTGLVYQDMKERGIYTIDLQSYDSVGFYNEVESFEIDPVNPNEIIYNTKEVTVYDSIDYYEHTTPYFKYKYINVPLIVGFKFFQKEKFTASVETGVLLSMMVEKDVPNADYYNPDYTVVRIHNNTPERVDWNLLWQIGINLNYRFYKSMSVSAAPVFTKYLNSIYDTKKGYSNVKPYSMGLCVGVYYGF